jgi:hypothetical protein
MFILLYTRDGRTRRHELMPGETVVGRAPVCDVSIDDPSISRRHIQLRVHGGQCHLTDLGGRNGTFLNGEEVTESEVHAGDTIVLGRFPIRIEYAGRDPVVLSDRHVFIEGDGSICRSLDAGADTLPGVQPAVSADRLLLLIDEITRHLAGVRPLAELPDRIVSVAFATTAADRVFLLLVEGSSENLVPRIIRSRDDRPIPNVSLNRATVRRVIQDMVAILASDAPPDAGVSGSERLRSEHVRSFICVPLWTAGQVVGVLYADKPLTSPLGAADLDVLQALAAYAAAAIAGAPQTDVER